MTFVLIKKKKKANFKAETLLIEGPKSLRYH